MDVAVHRPWRPCAARVTRRLSPSGPVCGLRIGGSGGALDDHDVFWLGW